MADKWKPPSYAVPANPRSLIGKVYDWGTTPLTDAPRRLADKIVEATPRNDLAYQRLNDLYGGLGTAAAMYQGFGEGALQGLGDVVSGFTAPFDLAATVMGGGAIKAGAKGAGKLASILRRGTQIASAPAALHGASNVFGEDNDLATRGMGLAELAGGIAGMHFPESAIRPGLEDIAAAVVPEQRLLPAGPRFHVDPTGNIIDVNTGMRPRQSTEIPYKRAGEMPRFMAGEEGISDLSARFGNKPRSEVTPRRPFETEDPDIPLFARSEKGGVKLGVNIKRAADELITGYSSPIEGIMVREALQNAIDAVRPLGQEGNIDVRIGHYEDKPSIEISDNGKGLTRQELETVFTDLHSSGKTGEAGATGGKGVGKAPYLAGGEHTRIETVAFVNGKKIKSILEGTPEQFMEHVDINEEVVPLSTPTGTKVQVKLKEGQSTYSANRMLTSIKEHSRNVPGKLNVESYGVTEPFSFADYTKDKVISRSQIGSNDITVAIPEKAEIKPQHSITVNYLNNGMYQFQKELYLPEETPGIPDKVIVDIHPLVEEGTTDYPFPVQRESIKDEIQNQIEELIKNELVTPMATGRKTKLAELYAALPTMPSTTKRPFVLFDPGGRLTPEELMDMQTSPVINAIAVHLDNAFQKILGASGYPNWSEKLEKIGIVLDPGMHGVHIPNPLAKNEKSAILINPFINISDKTPVDASLDIITTSMHEAAHIGKESEVPAVAIDPEEVKDPRVGKILQSYLNEVIAHGGRDMGHGMSFVKRLGVLYGRFGPKPQLKLADDLQRILTDNTGRYNDEVSKLLSIYQESRGRGATVEDLLSGTGVKQPVRKSGEGNIPPGSKPTGKRVASKRAIDKLFSALEEHRGLREEQEAIYSKERSKRFAEFSGVKDIGIKGAKKSLSKLRGEYEKVEGEAIGLTQKETDDLFTAVKIAGILPGEKARGYTALFKLLEGQVPQRNEIRILDEVFGAGTGERLLELHGGIGAVGLKVVKTTNTMKAAMSIADVSAPLRQGIGLIHRREWRDAFGEMFKYLTDEKYYTAAMQALERRPTYLLGREAGLFISKPGNIFNAEEAFANSYIGHIPAVKHVAAASERAYSGFLNKLRADVFDNMIAQAKKGGSEAFTVSESLGENGEVIRSITPSQGTAAIANFINIATGRGSLDLRKFGRQGKSLKGEGGSWNLEKIAPELNAFIWSPRLISSRLSMFDPTLYTNMPKGMRKEAVKSLLAIAGFGITAANLAAVLGGGKVSNNPLSSDYGKARFGEKVLDPYGGYQQYVVAAARFIKGANEADEQTRMTTLERFGTSKLSPIASLAYDILSAREFSAAPKREIEQNTVGGLLYNRSSMSQLGGHFTNRFGKQTSVPREIVDRFVPMFTQDIVEVLQNDPSFAEAVSLLVPSALGAGVQEYPEKRTNAQSQFRRMSLQP